MRIFLFIDIFDEDGKLIDRFSMKETSIVEAWHHIVNRLKLSFKTAGEVSMMVDLFKSFE